MRIECQVWQIFFSLYAKNPISNHRPVTFMINDLKVGLFLMISVSYDHSIFFIDYSEKFLCT